MVRIGPLSIGVLGLATLALLVPVAGGFVRAGGVAAAQRGGERIAGFVEDPVSGIFGSLFDAARRFGFGVGEDIRGQIPGFGDTGDAPEPDTRPDPGPVIPVPPPTLDPERSGFRTRDPSGNIDIHDIFHRLVSSGPEHLTDAGHARLSIATSDLSFQVRAFEQGQLSEEELRSGFRRVQAV